MGIDARLAFAVFQAAIISRQPPPGSFCHTDRGAVLVESPEISTASESAAALASRARRKVRRT